MENNVNLTPQTPQKNSDQIPIEKDSVNEKYSRGGAFFRQRKLVKVKRHALSEFWDPINIPTFINFLYESCFEKFVTLIYKSYGVKNFAHLLHYFRTEFTYVNFIVLPWRNNINHLNTGPPRPPLAHVE